MSKKHSNSQKAGWLSKTKVDSEWTVFYMRCLARNYCCNIQKIPVINAIANTKLCKNDWQWGLERMCTQNTVMYTRVNTENTYDMLTERYRTAGYANVYFVSVWKSIEWEENSVDYYLRPRYIGKYILNIHCWTRNTEKYIK